MKPRVVAALLLLCVAYAHASGLNEDPYTLADGTIVDPTDPESVARASSSSSDSLYMPLSGDGPMGGTEPHGNSQSQTQGRVHGKGNSIGRRRRAEQHGIRSEFDDGHLV